MIRPKPNYDNEIKQAVKKLISQVYYDKSNTNLHLRAALAKNLHDQGFDQLVNRVKKYLLNNTSIEPGIDELIKRIKYKVIPKSATSDSLQISGQYLSNNRIDEYYSVKDVNLIIDAPLEIHVLSILWLMKLGVQLDANLLENCYGNRLVLNDDEENPQIERGRALLKPYIRQYQKWRDEGIRKAKSQLDENNNVAFINLDISGYYYNVRIDWDSLEIDTKSNKVLKRLNNILKKVHEHYTQLVVDNYPVKCGINPGDEIGNKVILPLGLFSSYTLANDYLKHFDNFVEDEIRPEYYGRYVDDIVIVLNKPKLNEKATEEQTLKIIEQYKHEIKAEEIHKLPGSVKFIINNLSLLFRASSEDQINGDGEVEYKFRLKSEIHPSYNTLSIQNKKVLVYEFIAGQSLSVIEKLIKDIEDRSSEFRFLPTDEDSNFDKDAFELLYDDSFGKPRTLKDYKESKLGLATYLYRRSSVALWADKSELRDESGKILAFFNGINLINFYQYWERVFTYLVIANRKQEIIELLRCCFNEIDKIKYKGQELEIKRTLREYLSISLAQACTLNPQIFCDEWIEKQIGKINKEFTEEEQYFDDWYNETSRHILFLRRRGFVRNFYIPHPLLEFTDWSNKANTVCKLPSLIDKKFDWEEITDDNFKISLGSNEIPRFIRLFECSVYTWYKTILEKEWIKEESKNDFLPIVLKEFEDLNGNSEERSEELFDAGREVVLNPPGAIIKEIHIDQGDAIDFEQDLGPSNKLYLGLANMRVDWQNEASRSVRGTPVVNTERYNRISKILNKFEGENPEPQFGILPECSIPHDFLGLMTNFTKRHQKGFVFGTEHVNDGTYGYNFIMTSLPIKLSKRNDAILIPRLKNHYSPQEKKYIEGYHLKIAKAPVAKYHLFKWRNLYFTTFYCFELADIVHRSLFRSKIDLMVVSELNKDINYFSTIVESTARDLNTLVAQANSSQYGDNRVTRPAKSHYKNICRVDGGKNDLVIVSDLDLKKLREHQLKAPHLQKNDKVYKPSPPNFEIDYVKKRIKGEWIFKEQEYE